MVNRLLPPKEDLPQEQAKAQRDLGQGQPLLRRAQLQDQQRKSRSKKPQRQHPNPQRDQKRRLLSQDQEPRKEA